MIGKLRIENGKLKNASFPRPPVNSLTRQLVFSLTCFLVTLLTSCDRRELTYYTEAEIEITADWSQSGLITSEQAYGATAVFYPQDGSTPKVVLMGDRTRKIVRLREGCYNIILFNRSFNDFSGISFCGEDSYQSLEAYAKKLERRDSQLLSDGYELTDGEPEYPEDVVTESLDELAADCIENFEVTPEMLGNYSPTVVGRNTRIDSKTPEVDILHFIPRKLTQEITTTVHVKGLHNIRSATGTLSRVTASVFLSSGKLSEQEVTQEFVLSNPVFNSGSYTEGILSATFNVFGFDENLPHDVRLNALLVDGKTRIEEDLTIKSIKKEEEADGTTSITIEMSCDVTVPDVKPEGGSDSGFDVEVDGWGDDVNTEVPI